MIWKQPGTVTILINLPECESKEQAQDLIFNGFVQWFGMHIASEHIDRAICQGGCFDLGTVEVI
jgi:hypothetical protein